MAKTAIARGYVFIGFDLNGIKIPSIDYALTHDDLPPDMIPQDFKLVSLDKNELESGKSEFRRWIVANGFSEYIHITSLFYDRLYSALLFVEYLMKKRDPSGQIKLAKKFHAMMSLSDKIGVISREMDIGSDMIKYIDPLNRMRNCMIHTAGTITRRHCNEGERLIIKWPRLVMKSGSDKDNLHIIKKGDRVEAGGIITV